ncbi:MAG: hypothetical protein HZB52_13485 [Chloroflexi bacterium]|nr:hypothetical protein [Chloroflexota bacterium]
MIVARRAKQRSLTYRIETTVTRWAADITHTILSWRKTKRIPAIFIKESAIAFGLCSAFSLSATWIAFRILFNS